MNERLLDAYTCEYSALKSEQLKRIEHRDQIVYLQIVVIGALLGLKSDFTESLVALVVPFPCIALGWIYLVNDQKISAIGQYIRTDLAKRYKDCVLDDRDDRDDSIFNWESWNAKEAGRQFRKFVHLIINIFVFIMPGGVALVISVSSFNSSLANFVMGVEGVLLLVLLVKFLFYSDFKLPWTRKYL